jgi:hypothetical protein
MATSGKKSWPPAGNFVATTGEKPMAIDNRGLLRWSKKDENHLALLQLASGLIAFKKAHAATPTPAY